MKDGFDVKALRAFRVLRPLRLVSGVPSKFSYKSAIGCLIDYFASVKTGQLPRLSSSNHHCSALISNVEWEGMAEYVI